MAAPALSDLAQRLVDTDYPLTSEDADYGYAFQWFAAARAKALNEEVWDLLTGVEDAPPFAALGDPETVPVKFIGWLGQFVGVRPAAGLVEDEQRARLRAAAGFKRGTVASLRAAPEPFLTGTKTVYFSERAGSAYAFNVATIASETPDPDAVERALLAQKPAGLTMTYSTITGGTWADLEGTHADWAEVDTDFTDWADVRSDPTQT